MVVSGPISGSNGSPLLRVSVGGVGVGSREKTLVGRLCGCRVRTRRLRGMA